MRFGVFFFNDTATTEIYTLSYTTLFRSLGVGAHLLNVLPDLEDDAATGVRGLPHVLGPRRIAPRSEEHTSELQSRQYLVCRLLLEKTTQSTIPLLFQSTYLVTHPSVASH